MYFNILLTLLQLFLIEFKFITLFFIANFVKMHYTKRKKDVFALKFYFSRKKVLLC